jgi:CheY-like chemotaxis protein
MEPKGVKVLLVDDEKSFRRPMKVWLKSLNYQVISKKNGETAIASIEKERPTVIFLDIQLPEMDGIETLKRIREIDKDLPVIMLTAYATEERIEEAIKLGIDGFFLKSESFDRAYNLIQTVLNRLKNKQNKSI